MSDPTEEQMNEIFDLIDHAARGFDLLIRRVEGEAIAQSIWEWHVNAMAETIHERIQPLDRSECGPGEHPLHQSHVCTRDVNSGETHYCAHHYDQLMDIHHDEIMKGYQLQADPDGGPTHEGV